MSEDVKQHMKKILAEAQSLFDQWMDTGEQYAQNVSYWRERAKKAEAKTIQAIGWAYADCCGTLDQGGDPRKTEMPGVLERATKELELE